MYEARQNKENQNRVIQQTLKTARSGNRSKCINNTLLSNRGFVSPLSNKLNNLTTAQFYIKTTYGGVYGYSSSAKNEKNEAGRDKTKTEIEEWPLIHDEFKRIVPHEHQDSSGKTYMRDAYDCAEPNAFANYLKKEKATKGYITMSELKQKLFSIATDKQQNRIPPCDVCSQWMNENSTVKFSLSDCIVYPQNSNSNKNAEGYNKGYEENEEMTQLDNEGYQQGKSIKEQEKNDGYREGYELKKVPIISTIFRNSYIMGVTKRAEDQANKDVKIMNYNCDIKSVNAMETELKGLYKQKYNNIFHKEILNKSSQYAKADARAMRYGSVHGNLGLYTKEYNEKYELEYCKIIVDVAKCKANERYDDYELFIKSVKDFKYKEEFEDVFLCEINNISVRKFKEMPNKTLDEFNKKIRLLFEINDKYYPEKKGILYEVFYNLHVKYYKCEEGSDDKRGIYGTLKEIASYYEKTYNNNELLSAISTENQT